VGGADDAAAVASAWSSALPRQMKVSSAVVFVYMQVARVFRQIEQAGRQIGEHAIKTRCLC
jgi:hypothetical protein